MHVLKAIIRSIGLLFLLGSLYLLFQFAYTLLIIPKQDHLNYIPEQAELVIRINSNTILKNTIHSVFIDSGDTKLVNDLYKKLIKNKRSNKNTFDFGIDFKSDVIVFKMPFKTSYVIGFLFRLNDKTTFETTIGSTATAQQVAIAHNQFGLVLNYAGKERNHESAIDLEQLADIILSNSTKKQKVNQKADSWLSVSGKENDLELSLEKNNILFNGSFTPTVALQNKPNKQLKEKGFRFSSSNISNFFALLPEASLDYLNFNFLGYGEETENGLPRIQFELLLGFASKIDVFALLKDKFNIELELGEHGDQISVMGQTYFYKELDDHTIYIGSSKNPELETRTSPALLTINGAPSNFFNFSTDSFLLTMMEINPKFQAAKQLALKTKSVNVNMVLKKNKQVHVSGKIKFQEGTYAINEIIRFLMTANYIP